MIKLNQVQFGYGKRTLFKGLSMELNSGSICGLLGKNGAGKTTLLKLIAGLLTPSNGQIQTLDHTPSWREPSFLSEIYVLPEEFDLPRISIEEYAKYYGGFYPNFSNDYLQKLLREFEVEPDQVMQTMSFGQKKKALVSFALACNTRLLLMDEPTNGMDIPSKSQFRRVIASAANDNRTIIISTHQVRDLDQLIDHIIILEQSDILLNASTEKITSKLLFKHLEPTEEALYSEQTMHGRWGVVPNLESEESPLDMELLFNSVTLNSQTIKNLFNNEQ